MNAKAELLEVLESTAKPLWAAVLVESDESETTVYEVKALLLEDYTEEQWEEFLKALDYEYAEGYGTQYLFGFVMLVDGTWLERYEYDGAERWDHKKPPQLAKLLKLTEPRS
jgi:hypothetical protein